MTAAEPLTAERVEVVDGDGRVRATLTEEGLTLFDADGDERVSLLLTASGPSLVMRQGGKAMIELLVVDGPEAEQAGAHLVLCDGEGHPAAGFYVTPDGRVEQHHNPKIGDRHAGR